MNEYRFCKEVSAPEYCDGCVKRVCKREGVGVASNSGHSRVSNYRSCSYCGEWFDKRVSGLSFHCSAKCKLASLSSK